MVYKSLLRLKVLQYFLNQTSITVVSCNETGDRFPLSFSVMSGKIGSEERMRDHG